MDTSKIIVAVVLVVLLAGGAYFYFQNQTPATEMSNKGSMMTQSAAPAASASHNSMMASDSGMMEATGTVKVITVEGSNFKFAPATINVNKGDTVKVTFKNTGGFHDFVVDEFEGAKTKQIGANAEETIQFVADKAGTFEYYCSVGNHRGMGMKGQLIVK